MKATFLQKLTKGFRGDARLYQLDPPLDGNEFVVVSGIDKAIDTLKPETFIFKANGKGEVLDWLELPGSFEGSVDHVKALEGAGYTIVVEQEN